LEPTTSDLRPEIVHDAHIACIASMLSLKSGASAVEVVFHDVCFKARTLPSSTALAPDLRLSMEAIHAM
jgi:hypothetical protein